MLGNRLSPITAVALALTLSLLGCTTKTPQPAHAPKPITLQFWTLQLKPFAQVIEPLLAEFEAAHPNTRVQWIDLPFAEGEKRVLAALSGQTVPDVVNLNPEFSALLMARGALRPISSEGLQHAYLPAAIDAATLRETPNDNHGRVVGFPWYLTTKITVMNNTFLPTAQRQQANVAFSTDHAMARLSELAAETAQTTPPRYAIMPSLTTSGGFLKTLWGCGFNPYLTEATQTKPNLTTPEAQQTLQFWQGFFEQGWIPKASLIEGPQAALERYQSGQLALLQVGANFLTQIQDNAPTVFAHTQVFPQFPLCPIATGQTTQTTHTPRADFSLMVLSIPQRSAHPTEALALAAFMTQTKAQLKLALAAPVLPSTPQGLAKVCDARNADNPQQAPLFREACRVSVAQMQQAQTGFPLLANQKQAFRESDQWVQGQFLNALD